MGTEQPHHQPGEATVACKACVFIGAVEDEQKKQYSGVLGQDSLLLCVCVKKEVEKAFPKWETGLPLLGCTIWALFCLGVWFSDRVLLCPGTPYVNHAVLKLTEIHQLCLVRSVCHHAHCLSPLSHRTINTFIT